MSTLPENKNEIANVFVQVGHNDNDPLHLMYEMESDLINKTNEKIFLGDYKNKRCRFCNQDKTQTSFKKKAHVIPEFMGNKKYFSNFECNSCNEHFSKYESSLSNYGGILNTFSKLKGKKGYQKHKGKNENTETFVENDNIKMLIHNPSNSISQDQQKSVSIDSQKETISFDTNKYSYVPINAYKALIKIGFCMLDNSHLPNYELTRKWLLEQSELCLEQNNPLYHVYQKIGGRMFLHPCAVLMKKREVFENQPSPTHTLLLFYGLFAFQIFLPGNLKDNWIWEGNDVVLPIENHISYSKLDSDQHIKLNVDKVDLSSRKLLKNPKHSFNVNFMKT